jgi:hypothetical protein
MSLAHSSVASSTPMRSASSRSSPAFSIASTTQPGTAAPLMCAMRVIWPRLLMGMMPGSTGLLTPSVSSSSTITR